MLSERQEEDTYHAKWVNFESTEHATTSVFIALNSSIRSLKAIISVGQTNVLGDLRQDKVKISWESQ